jgi:hypothetical protein
MHSLTQQRRRARGLLPWLLSCVFIAQSLFPIQAHTQLVVQPDGMVVVICSLMGERTEVVGNDREGTDPLDEYRSPACLFSTLLGATVVSSPLLVPEASFLTAAWRADSAQDLATHRKPLVQSIRGPPSA